MTAIPVMQMWLALEHEAVWLLPLVGARFDELADLSRQSWETHLATRDALLDRLHQAGAEPVATALSYDVGPLSSAKQAREAVRSVEKRLAAAALALVGEVDGRQRAFATRSVRRAGLADLAWGGTPTAFPGLPDMP